MFEGKFNTSLSMGTVVGGINGDYFNFFCEKCGTRVKVRFLGYENTTPKFESACKCGVVSQFKALIFDIPDTRKI